MRDRPIRLLYILPVLADDGPSKVVLSVCRNLPKQRYNITICSLSDFPPNVINIIDGYPGLRCISLGVNSIWDLRTLFRILILIKKDRPDIVHTHLIRPDWYGRTAAWICHVSRVCTTVHSEDDLSYRSEYRIPNVLVRIIEYVNRLTARRANAIIAVSKAVRAYLVDRQGIAPNKIVLIPNGVDTGQVTQPCADASYLRQIYNIPPDCMVVGTVAALRRQKGLQFLVKAASLVACQYPAVKFLLVGSGPLESAIRSWVKEAGLDYRFILAGQRQDIPQLLAGMDVFALSSLWEGMPIALLEAMALGRPCVAPDIGGPQDIIESGKSGLLVPPSNYKALAQAIQDLLQNADQRKTLGEAARKRIESEFSAELAAKAHDILYRKLVSSTI